MNILVTELAAEMGLTMKPIGGMFGVTKRSSTGIICGRGLRVQHDSFIDRTQSSAAWQHSSICVPWIFWYLRLWRYVLKYSTRTCRANWLFLAHHCLLKLDMPTFIRIREVSDNSHREVSHNSTLQQDVYPDSRGLSQQSFHNSHFTTVILQSTLSREHKPCVSPDNSWLNINFLGYQSFSATFVFGVKLQRRSSGICHPAQPIITQASK